MTKKRVAPFDPPTAADLTATPDQVLKAPKGGLMWKCAYCGRPASSESVKGLKICRAHGGSTAAQRDPVARRDAAAKGETVKSTPGRPIEHGMYTRVPGRRVDEIVADYQAREVDPDQTDENMLYLHANIEVLQSRAPAIDGLDLPIARLLEGLTVFGQAVVPAEGVSVEEVLKMTEQTPVFTGLLRDLTAALKQLRGYNADLQSQHARVITLAKVRAETRVRDSAGEQLEVFALLLGRTMKIIREQLGSQDMAALQKRLDRELQEVPARLLEGAKVQA